MTRLSSSTTGDDLDGWLPTPFASRARAPRAGAFDRCRSAARNGLAPARLRRRPVCHLADAGRPPRARPRARAPCRRRPPRGTARGRVHDGRCTGPRRLQRRWPAAGRSSAREQSTAARRGGGHLVARLSACDARRLRSGPVSLSARHLMKEVGARCSRLPPHWPPQGGDARGRAGPRPRTHLSSRLRAPRSGWASATSCLSSPPISRRPSRPRADDAEADAARCRRRKSSPTPTTSRPRRYGDASERESRAQEGQLEEAEALVRESLAILAPTDAPMMRAEALVDLADGAARRRRRRMGRPRSRRRSISTRARATASPLRACAA